MRDKKNIVKAVKVTLMSFLWVCFASLNSMAAQNTLSAIEIKDSDNGYQVILKADKSSEVRKTVESRDDITIDVKGILPLESVGTVYNNVPDIDSVMIQPDADENTKIIIHGKNIASANVYFAPVETVQPANVLANSANEIELSKPMQSYAPVYSQEQEFQDLESNGMFETATGLAIGKAHQVKPYLIKIIRYLKQVDRKFLALGAIFSLIILFGLKSVKPEKNNEIKIGLSQSLKDKEMAMREELSLGGGVSTLRNQNLAAGKSVPSINYGIKAYQNSQRNPYTSQISGLPMKNVYNTQAKKPMSAPSTLAAKRPAIDPSVQGGNIDSMKFLESMTKIYERSGRADLANELKSSMQKVQIPN